MDWEALAQRLKRIPKVPPPVNETLTKRSKKIRAKVEENKIKRDKRIVGARIDDKASSGHPWSTKKKALVGVGAIDPPPVSETLTKRSKKIRAKVEENEIKRDKRIVGARIDDKASSVKSWSTEEKALVGAGAIGAVAVVGGAGAAIYNRDKIKRYFKLSKLRNLKKKIWADFKLKVVCYNCGTMGKYIEFCIVSKGSNGLFEKEISTFSFGMFDKDLKDKLVSKVNSVLLDFVKSRIDFDCSDDIVESLAADLVSRDVDFSDIEEAIGRFRKKSP